LIDIVIDRTVGVELERSLNS